MREHTEMIRSRNGWSTQETMELFKAARTASKDGLPIKSVFDTLAKRTGRKPNSIRNYYYLKRKENDGLTKTVFVPFHESEVASLVKTMLIEQSKGRSLRSVALELAVGDKKAMLRYQNKYRSLLKSNPEYIRQVIAELEKDGMTIIDPFAKKKRAKNTDLSAVLSELTTNLTFSSIDIFELFSALNTLAAAAVSSGEACQAKKISLLEDEIHSLSLENEALMQKNKELSEKYLSLSALNQAFLAQNGVDRITSLTAYLAEIQKQMQKEN